MRIKFATFDQFPEDWKIHSYQQPLWTPVNCISVTPTRACEKVFMALHPYNNVPHENHHGVKAPDWQLSWLMSVLIGRRPHPTALFPTDITVDTLAANDFNRKRLLPGPVDVQAWASLWYKWRQVIHLYAVSIELSAQKYHPCCTELHITALQPWFPWDSHPPQPRRSRGWMEGWRDGHRGSITRSIQTTIVSSEIGILVSSLSTLLMIKMGIIDSPQTQHHAWAVVLPGILGPMKKMKKMKLAQIGSKIESKSLRYMLWKHESVCPPFMAPMCLKQVNSGWIRISVAKHDKLYDLV